MKMEKVSSWDGEAGWHRRFGARRTSDPYSVIFGYISDVSILICRDKNNLNHQDAVKIK